MTACNGKATLNSKWKKRNFCSDCWIQCDFSPAHSGLRHCIPRRWREILFSPISDGTCWVRAQYSIFPFCRSNILEWNRRFASAKFAIVTRPNYERVSILSSFTQSNFQLRKSVAESFQLLPPCRIPTVADNPLLRLTVNRDFIVPSEILNNRSL